MRCIQVQIPQDKADKAQHERRCKHSCITTADKDEILQSQTTILPMMEQISNCVHFSNSYSKKTWDTLC